MPTTETALPGGIPPANLDQGSTIPVGFVVQLRYKKRPAYIMDRFGKLVIFDHVFDCQRLNADRLVFTDQFGREFVQEITAAISDTSMKTRYFLACFGSVLGPFFLLGMPSLSLCQFLFVFGKEAGIANNFTRRQSDEIFQAKISTDSLVSNRQLLNVFFHQNADEIAIGAIFGDGHARGFGIFGQGTRPADIKRLVHLGKGDFALTPEERIRSIASRLLPTPLFEGGVGTAPLEAIDESAVQMTQGLLQWNRRDLKEPYSTFLFLEVGQCLAQVLIVQALLLVIVGIRLFAECPVIDETATPEGLSKGLFLFVGRIDAILLRSLLLHGLHESRYRVNYQQFDPTQSPVKERASIPGMNDRGFTLHFYNVGALTSGRTAH
jgi:hypothetical protein